MKDRRGVSLVEVLVVGALLLLVLQTAWWVAASQARVAMGVVTGAQVLDGVRLSRLVLSTEVRLGIPGPDWLQRDGELHLRAFRGLAVGCGPAGSGSWAVDVSGFRQPDPDKDSVLVLGGDGAWRTSALAARRVSVGPGCSGLEGFQSEVWELDPAVADPVVGRYFERGAYRFSDGAFRYRRGAGGWQPLTAAGLRADSSWIAAYGTRAVQARMTWVRPGPAPESFLWTAWAPP